MSIFYITNSSFDLITESKQSGFWLIFTMANNVLLSLEVSFLI